MEQYSRGAGRVLRKITLANISSQCAVEDRADRGIDDAGAWWQSFLRGAPVFSMTDNAPTLRIVDAFCGCGGLSLGVSLAAIACGYTPHVNAAIDMDPGALAAYEHNLRPEITINANVDSLVDFHVLDSGGSSRFGYEPEVIEPALLRHVGNTDVLLAGPPCEGHSNFNNKTRRDDPRNRLYLSAVALGTALHARSIVIENVPEVTSDKGGVVEAARSILNKSGYRFVSEAVLATHELGGAQTRKRFFLVASKGVGGVSLQALKDGLRRPPYSVRWAISDLLNVETKGDGFDDASVSSGENQRRIEWLFENNEYNLANTERPDCHKNGHTYPSVYGRLWWEKPAQTITTGFQSPGRGRFIHPEQPRVITPHEAARLQSFPDSYIFLPQGAAASSKAQLSKLIGDAVPPVLGFVAGLAAIASMSVEG